MVFFQCMAALLSPVDRRRGGIKWVHVSYTVLMFSLATVYTATNLNVQSISFINNREFPGVEGVFPPGPLGYLWFNSRMLCTVPNLMFLLNNWLADGLMVGFSLDVVHLSYANPSSSSTDATWSIP